MTRIADYRIDMVISEQWSRVAELTPYVVESGATFTDHRHLNPDELTIEGVISETPMNGIAPFRSEGGFDLSPMQEAEVRFDEFWKSSEPIEVITASRIYKSMVMTGFQHHDDAATMGGFWFTCTFQQLKIADVERSVVSITKKVGGGHKLPFDIHNGKPIMWRWGRPPGAPHTVMDPVEKVFYKAKENEWWYVFTPRNRIGYVSKNKNRPNDPNFLRLTYQEVLAFTKDMQRDLENTLDSVEGELGKIGDDIAGGLAYQPKFPTMLPRGAPYIEPTWVDTRLPAKIPVL